ncbi:ubiquitin-related modifier 1 isoform X6 [Pipistrellus kuhlii]|uniref:ubiquitin-related modifier 1 isoform X6 n=1 Tax=Pipistrellus kuhlii TaxID=59472 RepID=UPI001E272AD6|nr:ubiquitin-related modifier 1 isoform X6 [Pipistrellus kuhlii]
MAAPLSVEVEFGGGAELLFDGVKKHQVTLPGQEEPWDIRSLLVWIKKNLLKERPELFIQGDSVIEAAPVPATEARAMPRGRHRAPATAGRRPGQGPRATGLCGSACGRQRARGARRGRGRGRGGAGRAAGSGSCPGVGGWLRSVGRTLGQGSRVRDLGSSISGVASRGLGEERAQRREARCRHP